MSLIYRGTSSDDVKFNVTERRVYNAPAFDVSGIEVPGRSGDILNSQERFKNKSIVYTGFIRSSDFPGDTTWERLSRGLRTIKAWVCGDAGKYHDLTDDYDPGFVRRAFVSGETAISEVLDRPDGATITITFMAEPFMYEESDPIELPETGTASGAIASFEGVAAPLQSLKFSIEPKQSGSGDPSPSNIRPISGWSQVDAVAAGKNLFPGCYQGTINQTTGQEGVGTNSITTYIRVTPGGTYTVSPFTGTSLALRVFRYNFAKGYIGTQLYSSSTGSFTITADENTHYIRLQASTQVMTIGGNYQFEEGSVASPYAAPTLTPITISLGQTVYGGTVDALAGKLTITDAIFTFDGSSDENWNTWVGNNAYYVRVTGGYKVANMTCNAFKWAGRTNRSAGRVVGEFIANADALDGTWNGNISFFYDNNTGGLANFKSWIAQNPLQVVYTLQNPIEVDLTPVSVNSLLGQNNIWANTGDTEVVYVEPTENPTEWPSKPRLEITMAGAGTLTVNGKTWSIGAYTGTLICDSEIMDWYDASNLKNSLVSGDGFPELQPGENVITYTGGITKVVATPRWRTL